MGSYVEEDGGKEGHPGDSRAQDCLKNRPPKRMRDERLPGSPGDQSDRRGFSAERAGFSMLGGEFFTTCGATSTVGPRLDLWVLSQHYGLKCCQR